MLLFTVKTSLWKKDTEQGSDWMYDTAQVRHKRNFYIEFVATKGLGSQGDIALDDIKFSNCAMGPSANLTIKGMAVNKTVGVDTDVVLDFTYDGAPLAYVTLTKDGDALPTFPRFSVGMDG